MVHASTHPKDAESSYDFIISGGGPGGSTVAGRLAENPNVRILLIEAGDGNTSEIPEVTTPARAMSIRHGPHDYNYKATFIDREDYTRVEHEYTRGKVLGGSTAVNYYTWLRGSAATIDEWKNYGGENWSYENVKQYFDKPATYHDDKKLFPESLMSIGDQGGPIHIAHPHPLPEIEDWRNALEKAWLSKGEELSVDVYHGEQKGLFRCVNTVYNGVRSNASFFVEGKSNITLLSNTVSKQIIFDKDQTATGIVVVGPDHKEYTFSAKREIIVSQGAIGSPQLLMLSGVGRKTDLEALGITSVIDSPHVGQNLQDHPVMTQVFKIKDGFGLDSHIRHSGPEHSAALQQYSKDKTGPFSSALLELVAFPRIDERLMKYEVYREAKAKNGGRDPFGPEGQPHFEIDFLPMFADAFQFHFPPPATGDYMTVIVDLLRPVSKPGVVKLLSTDPAKNPYINLNFLADDLDIICIREGVRYINDILMNGEGMRDLIEGDYPFPMPRTSDEAMDKQILERSQTGYHPCGSNRIGKDINHGVVDGELKVYGAKNLRISDASIFPLIPDCRIQNDVYMVGEKAADMIKAAHGDLYGAQ